MKLYEIDEAIMNLFDPDTGECVDYDALESLQMERDRKIEGIALWIKDLEADAVKIRNEEKALAERRRSMETKADNLTRFLAGVVGEGNKFSTSKCAISWRRSESVHVVNYDELKQDPYADNYLRYKDPEVDRAAIKAAIKDGLTVMGAELVTNNNMQLR